MSLATRVINRTLREDLKTERLITTGKKLENTPPEQIKTYLRQKIATVSLWQNPVVSGGPKALSQAEQQALISDTTALVQAMKNSNFLNPALESITDELISQLASNTQSKSDPVLGFAQEIINHVLREVMANASFQATVSPQLNIPADQAQEVFRI